MIGVMGSPTLKFLTDGRFQAATNFDKDISGWDVGLSENFGSMYVICFSEVWLSQRCFKTLTYFCLIHHTGSKMLLLSMLTYPAGQLGNPQTLLECESFLYSSSLFKSDFIDPLTVQLLFSRFKYAPGFNRPLDSWDVGKSTGFKRM